MMIKTNDKGQSTIEFLVSLTLVFGFIFSFFKIAIVYTNGYLVHYVNFLSSRAYMVGEANSKQPNGSDATAKQFADEIFEGFNLPGIITNFDSTLQIESPQERLSNATNLYIGTRVEYQANILIPGTAAKIDFPMVSESYLGMEPTRAECFVRICDAMAEVGSSAGCLEHATVTDNGC